MTAFGRDTGYCKRVQPRDETGKFLPGEKVLEITTPGGNKTVVTSIDERIAKAINNPDQERIDFDIIVLDQRDFLAFRRCAVEMEAMASARFLCDHVSPSLAEIQFLRDVLKRTGFYMKPQTIPEAVAEMLG